MDIRAPIGRDTMETKVLLGTWDTEEEGDMVKEVAGKGKEQRGRKCRWLWRYKWSWKPWWTQKS